MAYYFNPVYMALTIYKKKRNFNKTKEPRGAKRISEKELIFVVQKHDASHLHYDFRLEVNGVLKSWAVPKGPSMNPKDKRLAMMVEDHPYNYKDFEGTIPEGNYGAGNVIVWDNGNYREIYSENKKQSETNILTGIKKGHISFVLNGKKLKGEFSLIKLKGKQKNAWLLIKKEDSYGSEKNILEKDHSVLSRKKLVAKKRTSSPKIKVKKTINYSTTNPIKPMLSKLYDSAFDDKNWMFEIKYDGYRAIARIDDEVQLLSRNNLSFNKLFAPIKDELKKIKHHAILDGEIVVENDRGHSDFQLLQKYQQTGKGKLKYYVFDLLNLDGNSLLKIPLSERKKLLELLLKKTNLKNVFFSEHILNEGKLFYDLAVKHGLEGIMAKNANSQYYPGKRNGEWLKIKIHRQEEAVIGGFTAPKGSRVKFGSLLLGAYHGRELNYIGNCGTGFTEQTLDELYHKLVPYFTLVSPFKEKIKIPGKIQWVKPELVCQVKFSEWTEDKRMRHPVFMGLRIDKKPNEVIALAKGKSKRKINAGQTEEKVFDIQIGNISVHLTNQQKIYFPHDHITKGDIVNYYKEIAPVILPYLEKRPQSMNRFPNGIKGESFYQKDVNTSTIPEWIKTEKIYSESNKKYIDYLICNDTPTLLYMANLGCIEINPWNSRIDAIEKPDWAVIDLDPENINFKEVVKVALTVRKVLEELEIESYCKTSGASGLHVFIPLAAKYDYTLVKTFAELIGQKVSLKLPAITSIIRNPKKRQKKVYVDYLQNRRGQTLAAPYSVRPKPGATVSTPLEWKEVNNKLNPLNFTIKTIFKRLEKKGDLWKPVIGKGVYLNKIIKKVYQSEL